MRFLCLSDIHGNAYALRKILREADARGFDQLIVCGDLCYPGPDALEVWKLLVKRNALCVQGVGDRALANLKPESLSSKTEEGQARIKRLREVREELGELIIARLAKLPTVARLPLESGHTMLIVHGTPGDPTESFGREMSEDELIARLGDEPGDIVICGSSHEQFEGEVADVHIVSVGSVGEAPGGTHALGAIVDSTPAGFSATLFSVALGDEDGEHMELAKERPSSDSLFHG
jgi:predicted phosphodiesterase